MLVLVVGLLVFFVPHSIRIFGEGLRRETIEAIGEGPWKGLYSLVSLVGLVLIVWGYGRARIEPIELWTSPEWLRLTAIPLNLLAFILLAAFLLPAGSIKARMGHPMILAVKVWAFAHLLANGTLADLVLFGAFLVWAIADFAVSRRRDRAQGIVRIAGPARNDMLAVAVGAVLWAAFLWRVHYWITGVMPLA
jgi:uncharacterized membrane protein